MPGGRVALAAAIAAVAAYLAWTAAVADQEDATVWTVVAALVFWSCVVVVVLYLGGLAVRGIRSRR